MKQMKIIISSLMIAGVLYMGTDVYAVDTDTGTISTLPYATDTGEVMTVPRAQEAKSDENYVRITQPILKDQMQTFDSQINIMGEATVGTEIQIRVYYGDEEFSYLSEEAEEYTLKTVGATQTFSQLVDLEEGRNTIVVQYKYMNDGTQGALTIQINRIEQASRDLIKSYLGPSAIVENIVPPDGEALPSTEGIPESTNIPIDANTPEEATVPVSSSDDMEEPIDNRE